MHNPVRPFLLSLIIAQFIHLLLNSPTYVRVVNHLEEMAQHHILIV